MNELRKHNERGKEGRKDKQEEERYKREEEGRG